MHHQLSAPGRGTAPALPDARTAEAERLTKQVNLAYAKGLAIGH